MQEVYEQLKAREEKVRQAEAQLTEAEAEGLRRLRAREEGIEASLSAREARLAQQVSPLHSPVRYGQRPSLGCGRVCSTLAE